VRGVLSISWFLGKLLILVPPDVWGPTPDPAGGAYSAHPDPLAGFKGAYFLGNVGEGGKGGENNTDSFSSTSSPEFISCCDQALSAVLHCSL